MDKFLLLVVCKKPPAYDEKIEIKMTNILGVIIYLHLILALW